MAEAKNPYRLVVAVQDGKPDFPCLERLENDVNDLFNKVCSDCMESKSLLWSFHMLVVGTKPFPPFPDRMTLVANAIPLYVRAADGDPKAHEILLSIHTAAPMPLRKMLR